MLKASVPLSEVKGTGAHGIAGVSRQTLGRFTPDGGADLIFCRRQAFGDKTTTPSRCCSGLLSQGQVVASSR